MTQKALLAMLAGHFAFTAAQVEAIDYVVNRGDKVDHISLNSEDTLTVYEGAKVTNDGSVYPAAVYIEPLASGTRILNHGTLGLGPDDLFIDRGASGSTEGFGSTISFDVGGSGNLFHSPPFYGDTINWTGDDDFGAPFPVDAQVVPNVENAVQAQSFSSFSFSWDAAIVADAGSSVDIVNEATGRIVGDVGIVGEYDARLTIHNAGTIQGRDSAALLFSDVTQVDLWNSGWVTASKGLGAFALASERVLARNTSTGTISGKEAGLYFEAPEIYLINEGHISGEVTGVSLFGADFFDGRGTVTFENREGARVTGSSQFVVDDALYLTLDTRSVMDGDVLILSGGETRITIDGWWDARFSDIVTGTLDLCNCGPSSLIKTGSSILTLDRRLPVETLSIGNGGVIVERRNALRQIDVELQGGFFDPGTGTTVRNFSWESGHIRLALRDADTPLLRVRNLFEVTDFMPYLEVILDPSNLSERYSLISFGRGEFDTENFTVTFNTLPPGMEFEYTLEEVGGELQLIVEPTIMGNLLQNSGPINTPAFATFSVAGAARTGTPHEDNTIRSLVFNRDGGEESSLHIHNRLTVTSGSIEVPWGKATLSGDYLITPNRLTKHGFGDLDVGRGLEVHAGDDVVIEEGGLRVSGTLRARTAVYNISELIINGDVHAPVVYNHEDLGGSGTIHGNLVNKGIVMPGNSPGTLTVTGDFTQESDGTLVIEVESGSNYDRLVVGGQATLDGALAIGGEVSYGDEIRFLEAGSIVGKFDRIVTGGSFRVRLMETPTSITALLAPKSYSDLATNANHRSVANALDRYINATSGDRKSVSLALDYLGADEYANAFQQISPAFHETIATQAINLSQQQGRLLSQRIGTSRYGLRGFRSATLEPTLRVDRDGKSAYQSKAVKETITTVEEENRWSTWLEGNGVFSKVTQAQQVPNGKTRAGGFMVGADYAWSPNFITGLFAGYEALETKYDDSSRVTMDGSRFGGYATYGVPDSGLYVDGIVWGGVSDFRADRRIDFGSIDRSAWSRQQAGEFSALLGTGYDWKPGNWIVGPTASLQYTYLGIDGFSEQGADSLDLKMDRQRVHSVRSNLGARVAYRVAVNESVVVVPELRASWEHEFANDARSLTGELGGTGISYRTSTAKRDSLFAGAGVNALFNNRVSTSLHYNIDVGRSNDTAHIVSASFGVTW